MPAIGNQINTEEILCQRCGSKRKLAKKWVEKVENANGFMNLVHKQYICTNKECQEKFDKALEAENLKREKIKLQKQGSSSK